MRSRVGHDDPCLGSHTRDHAFGDEVNGTLFMPGEVVHHHLLLTNHPLQKAWQGDPIVERIGLVGEHMDAAMRIKLAQGLRGGRAGHSIADNHIAFVALCQISTSSLLAEPWIAPPSPGVMPQPARSVCRWSRASVRMQADVPLQVSAHYCFRYRLAEASPGTLFLPQ